MVMLLVFALRRPHSHSSVLWLVRQSHLETSFQQPWHVLLKDVQRRGKAPINKKPVLKNWDFLISSPQTKPFTGHRAFHI